jgi:spermidine synthase
MAIIWEKQINGTHYEVRSAGRTRRLYSNGVFHSQYNPNSPITGSVWDLLMLPAFFFPVNEIKHVLVLGVGGGTVVQQLSRFVSPRKIIGVELNPVHVFVARRFFQLNNKQVQLYTADAVQWLRNYRGERFDMIIDDIFGEENGEPVRAVESNQSWCALLLQHLAPQGVLVSNFISPQQLRQSACCGSDGLRRHFKAVYQLTTPLNENAVGAFLRKESTSRILRGNLSQVRGLNPSLKTSKLRYQIRRL